MEFVLYGAGAVALLALAYLFWRLTATLKVLDTTIGEATTTIAAVRTDVLPLAEKAGVTVDALNAELLRIDGIITTIENATKNVEKTSGSISEIVNSPVEAVTDLAGKMRTAFRERRAEVRDAARRHEQAEAAAQAQDDARYGEDADVDSYDDADSYVDTDEGFVVLEESDLIVVLGCDDEVGDEDTERDEDETLTDEDL